MDYYRIYCDGVLGVKTNIRDFKWVYGSTAPEASPQDYARCAVCFEVILKPERELRAADGCERFQAYTWNAADRTLSYRRTMLGKLRIGYDLTVTDGKVVAEIGQNYYRIVQKRMMHLHGMYFLLSDLANVMLLRQGYLTLYASAVHDAVRGKGVACFAPPNTGKTLTATQLCAERGYRLIGEDVVIVRDRTMYACPWTMSYRKKTAVADSAGAFGRAHQAPEFERSRMCALTDVVVLASGTERVICDKAETLRRIAVLNGYLFEYYASPVVKILGYFDSSYDCGWNMHAQQLLKQLTDASACKILYASDPMRFSTLVDDDAGK